MILAMKERRFEALTKKDLASFVPFNLALSLTGELRQRRGLAWAGQLRRLV